MTTRRCAACLTPCRGRYCANCLAWHHLGTAVEKFAALRRPDPRDTAMRRLGERVRAIEDAIFDWRAS